jgi:hypothetical protein
MALRNFRISAGMFAAALLLLIAGGLLVGVSWWIRPASEAEEALRDGNIQRAADRYTAARQRFDRIPITQSVMSGIYNLVSANELALQYSLERYDDILGRAGTSGANEAASFWAGCALFDKGLMEEKPEARLSWIQQSHQEFRRALELAPDDWDTKFNFELTGKLTSGLQKQPKTSKRDMMKLLRESPKSSQPVVKKVS